MHKPDQAQDRLSRQVEQPGVFKLDLAAENWIGRRWPWALRKMPGSRGPLASPGQAEKSV